MDIAVLPLYLSALVAVYLLPGPDMALVIATGAAHGRRLALATSLGVALARGLHVLMSGAGLAALMAANPMLLDLVRWIGAAYLLILAVQVLRSDLRLNASARSERSARSCFLRGFLTNLMNPKALLFCGLFLPQFVSAAHGPALTQFLWLGAVLVLVGFAFDCVYATAAARIGQRMQGKASPLKKWLLPSVLVLMAGRLLAS
ncbi:LysE family translocator [Noviherbaspirillum sp. CPCC 100848]|uniref:LysE family translocator n=1 Tax=Noviherbaspirillum album TaxID=3080276 RepID=A0ABU6JGC0_9BURK|nr:LysE family translocator [Noviherbaspirillum sp. CPCC 100848]MEC4722463.1 LysE family translocator [Noviherbaspirillum sp. CPCC 100848]